MHDIETDIENVDLALYSVLLTHHGNTRDVDEELCRELAEAALNASTTVKQLKELKSSWLTYQLDMRPETRNNFLRACSGIFDVTPPKQKD